MPASYTPLQVSLIFASLMDSLEMIICVDIGSAQQQT